MRRNYWLTGGILLIAILAVAAVVYGQPLVSYLKDAKYKEAPKSEEAPQAVEGGRKIKLSDKSETYRISQAAEMWPRFLEAIIDPPDVHVGDTQKLTVIIQSPEKIESVEARTQLDNEFKVIPLKFVGEVALEDMAPNPYYVDQSGKLAVHPSGNIYAVGPKGAPYAAAAEYPRLKYEAEWTVYDTHDATYKTEFVARDVKGNENSVTFAWSDQCGIPLDGAWTSTADCTLSSNDAVERGNISLGSLDDINLNGNDLAINPGYSISIGTGSFIIGTNSEILFTYGWANDNDADNYIDETVDLRLQDTDPGTGWDRSYTKTGYGDCLDTDADVYRTVSGLATDADQEGYYTGSSGSQCVGANSTINGRTYYKNTSGAYAWTPSSAALGGSDCLDTNANVYRNITGVTDADHDEVYTGTSGTKCVGAATTINHPSCIGSPCSDYTQDYYKDSTGAYTVLESSYASQSGDCSDSNYYGRQNVANLAVDTDRDGYYTGSGTTRCANATRSYYGRTYHYDSTGSAIWIATTDARGGSDCDSTNYYIGFTSGATGVDRDADGIVVEAALHSQCVGALYNVTNGREYYRGDDGCYKWIRGYMATGYNDASDGTTCRTCGGQASCTE